jgi:hypothetical protein
MTNILQFNTTLAALRDTSLPQTVLIQAPYGTGQIAFMNDLIQSRISDGLSKMNTFIITVPKDKSMIPLAQVHMAQEFLAQTPLSGSQKIWVIFDADFLTVEGQNTFLKNIEEPTPSSYIFFVSSYKRLIPTIISRCHVISLIPDVPVDLRFGFQDIPLESLQQDMMAYLEILKAPLYARSAYIETILSEKTKSRIQYYFWVWETLHYLILLAHTDTQRYTEYSAFLSDEIQKQLQNTDHRLEYIYHLNELKESVLFSNRKASLALESLLLAY